MKAEFFKNNGPLSLSEIINIAKVTYSSKESDLSMLIEDVKPLDRATNTDISFFSNSKYLDQFKSSKARVCITSQEYAKFAPDGMIVLISLNPYASYALVLNKFYPSHIYKPKIASTAIIPKSSIIGNDCYIDDYVVIGENVEIGDGTIILAHSYIGDNVKIGSNCKIESSVTITYSVIGNDTIIFSGARVGQDGFGFANDAGKYIKVRHIGKVRIGNDVEIGAGTTIDRGSLDDTIIGDGCRIDNLVQLGHNVKLGRGCVVVAQAGVAGSTKVGDFCVIGGQVGIAGHLNIANQTTLLAKTGVTNNINEPGQVYAGYPMVLASDWRRQMVTLRNLVKKKG